MKNNSHDNNPVNIDSLINIIDSGTLGEEKNTSNKINYYKCNSCGTVFGAVDLKNRECVYCKSSKIESLFEDFGVVKGILPFNISLEEAKKTYKKVVLYNPLIPFAFKKKSNINSIKKVYLSTFLMNLKTNGDVIYYAADMNSIVKNGVKGFDTRKYEMSFTTNINYDKVIVNSYSKIKEVTLDYNTNNITSYDNTIDNDAFIIVPNISRENILENVKNEVEKNSLIHIRSMINHKIKKIKENNMVFDMNGYLSVLVPVYIINTKIKNKDYIFIMNGENGKYNISLKVGVVETVLFAVILSFIIGFIAYIICTLI